MQQRNRFEPATDRIIRRAEHRLAEADPIMKRLIAAHGRCPLATRSYEPFQMLANFIISQQLSTKAAAAIKQRLALSLTAPFAPETFLLLSGDQLRGAGLSQAKVRYITVLATNICERRLVFEEILRQDDEAVIRALSVCPGIGRWTAEMFLIFGLKRLDVLALGDAGLQRVCCMEKEVGGKICCRTWPRRGDPIAPWPRGICGDRWSSCDYLDAPELHTSLISSELAIRP